MRQTYGRGVGTTYSTLGYQRAAHSGEPPVRQSCCFFNIALHEGGELNLFAL